MNALTNSFNCCNSIIIIRNAFFTVELCLCLWLLAVEQLIQLFFPLLLLIRHLQYFFLVTLLHRRLFFFYIFYELLLLFTIAICYIHIRQLQGGFIYVIQLLFLQLLLFKLLIPILNNTTIIIFIPALFGDGL